MVVYREMQLLDAYRAKDHKVCESAFRDLTDVDKINIRSKGAYMIGVPRMFTDLDRVQRATNFVKMTLSTHTVDMFMAVCDCARRVFSPIDPDSHALYCALSFKYWLGDAHLSDFSTLFGKTNLDVRLQAENFAKRRTKWLQTVAKHTYNGSEETFYSTFDDVTRDLFTGMKQPREVCPFRDFVADYGTWARSGAVQSKEWKPTAGIRNTKWAYALTHSVDEVLAFLDAAKGKSVAYDKFLKPEPGAARWALTGALSSHILMSYISYHLDPLLGATKELFIFTPPEKQAEFWATRQTQARTKNTWFITGDYSGWDEGVTFRMTTTVAKHVLAWASGWNRAWVNEWSDSIYAALENFTVDGIKCLNGLPTGSRWTMMLNSICNLVLQRMAARQSGAYDVAVVGDDFDVAAESEEMAQRHLEALKDMGFTTAPHKTGIFLGTGEFLKNYYGGNFLTMSPLRTIRSLLYSQDVDRTDSDAERRLSRADMWARFLGRLRQWRHVSTRWNGVEIESALALMQYDIHKAFEGHIRPQVVDRWLRTPSIVGGAGLLPDIGENFVTIRAQLAATRGARGLSVGVIRRKHSYQNVLSQYITQTTVDTFVSKQLPQSFTVSVDLGRPQWRLAATALVMSALPPPRLQFPRGMKVKLPKDMSPFPDERGLFTSKVFGGDRYTFKELQDCVKTGAVWEDRLGRQFTKIGLIEVSFFKWVSNLHGISVQLRMELIRTGGLYPMPRELVALYGETLCSVLWTWSRPMIQKLFTKAGSSSETMLAGVLAVLRHYQDTMSQGIRYTLGMIGVRR